MRFVEQRLTTSHFLALYQVLFLGGALLAFGGCQETPPLSESASEGQVVLRKVRALPLSQAGPRFLKDRFTGIVRPHRTSQLAAKSLSRVDQVLVDIGDQVEHSQLLVQLDQQQLKARQGVAQASLDAADQRLAELEEGPRKQDIQRASAQLEEVVANLKSAEANFRRLQPLRQKRAISQQELEDAQYRVDALVAQKRNAMEQLSLLEEGTRDEQVAAQKKVVAGLAAQLEQIQVQLDEQQVLAPYAGQVQLRLVDEGEVVSPGQLLLQVVESGRLEIEVGIPTGIAEQVASGAVDVYLESDEVVADYPQQREIGKLMPVTSRLESATTDDELLTLIRAAPGIDDRTRTRTCLFAVPSDAANLTMGQAVQVYVKRTPQQSKSYWVPTEALSAGPRGLWVLYGLRADGNAYVIERSGPVTLLTKNDAYAEIEGPLGFDPDMPIVVAGTHLVVPGQRVLMADIVDNPTIAQDVRDSKRSPVQ